MRYFKLLRLKIGVATLALACVFAEGWIRRRGIEDEVVLAIGRSCNCFASQSGWLSWWRWTESPETAGLRNTTMWYSQPTIDQVKWEQQLLSEQRGTPYTSFSYHDRSYRRAVEIDRIFAKDLKKAGDSDFNDASDFQIVKVEIRFSVIVPTVALASTWLLLSKPKRPSH